MTGIPLLSNKAARRVFLDLHGLSGDPNTRQSKDNLLDLIGRIGFVQVDSIQTVERAHHMILFARNRTYRKKHLTAMLEKDRTLFEHWTHDASIIPVAFYPYWQNRFQRDAARLKTRWRQWRSGDFEAILDETLAHIERDGPVMSRTMPRAGAQEMTEEAAESEEDLPEKALVEKTGGGWWDWHPSKTALEYLWRTGALAVDRRRGFQKSYDLVERVVPREHRSGPVSEESYVDWACRSALDRLGFATPGELAAYWGAVRPHEARAWCVARSGMDLIGIGVESADGSPPRLSYARPDILERAADAPAPPSRVRVLSPFDPAIRDRARAERLFGFSYRIEVFVPEPKRLFGYYVFPLLEGDRLIGRIDMKRRAQGNGRLPVLGVTAFWPEDRVRLSKGRLHRLQAELERLCRFAGCEGVVFDEDWIRKHPA